MLLITLSLLLYSASFPMEAEMVAELENSGPTIKRGYPERALLRTIASWQKLLIADVDVTETHSIFHNSCLVGDNRDGMMECSQEAVVYDY